MLDEKSAASLTTLVKMHLLLRPRARSHGNGNFPARNPDVQYSIAVTV